jgi:heme exporter protein D
MSFDSFSDFIAMGKHGFYVWTAYGVVLLGLVIMPLRALQRGHRVKRDIMRQIQRETRDES